MSPTQPVSIAFAPQVDKERPGTFGTAGSPRPADPVSFVDLDELAAWRQGMQENAQLDYEKRRAAILKQAEKAKTDLPASYVDRMTAEEDARQRLIRDNIVAKSFTSGLRPESTEPRLRIEGFDSPSSSPS